MSFLSRLSNLTSNLSSFSSNLAKKLGVENVSNSSNNFINTDSSDNKTAPDGSAEYHGWLKPKDLNTAYEGAELDRKSGFVTSRDSVPMVTNIDIPAWGYKNYINERVSWQKGLDNLYRDPSWMYFKIFFKFDSPYGLLGGVLNNNGSTKFKVRNTAIQYLQRNMIAKGKYDVNNLYARKNALASFVQLLSRISCKEPWLFSSIKDVNQALTMDFGNLSHEKELEIECKPDTTDWLLSTLFNLYKYACYDEINMKEIIPENLRKFDMDVIVFQAPLRYFHTSSRDLKGRSTPYKNFSSSNYGDRMSFQLFTFLNCEFDYKSLSAALPQNLTSENPFENKPTFKIKYERSYQHMNNEFLQLMFGSEGLLYSPDWYKDDENSAYKKDQAKTKADYDKEYEEAEEDVGRPEFNKVMYGSTTPYKFNTNTNYRSMLAGSGSSGLNNFGERQFTVNRISIPESTSQFGYRLDTASKISESAINHSNHKMMLDYRKSKQAEVEYNATHTTKYKNPNQYKRIEMLKYGDTNSLYYNPNSTVYKALVDASESTIGNAMLMMDTSTVLGNLYGKSSTALDDIKGIGKNIVNGYKNLGKNVWQSFTNIL